MSEVGIDEDKRSERSEKSKDWSVYLAAERADEALVSQLIEQGAEVDWRDEVQGWHGFIHPN